MYIDWSPSPNYSGRNGRKPIAIVNHITAGAFPGCLEWMKNPASQASAHYLVTKAGIIFQMVKDEAKAWHAGAVGKPNWKLYDGTNPNLYTIGIEHEGQPGDVMSDAQYQAALWLHKRLVQQWGIPIDTDHIIGHYRIDSVNRPNCPGPGFPWDRLFKDLKGEAILDKAIVYFSVKDFSTALMFAEKFGNCAMFCRNAGAAVHADAMKASQVITIGGPKISHANEVYLSGDKAVDTAKVAVDWLLGN